MQKPLLALSALAASVLPSFSAPSDTAPRPDIVLILADDLGYGDLRSYNPGSLIPTPNLDRLAAQGRSFTQAYCPVSVCSPSRYALLTGRYPFRTWKWQGVLANWERPMIDASTATLPGVLRSAGYQTVGYGKWHLGATRSTTDGLPPVGLGLFKHPNAGANIDLSASTTDGPLARGFDEWYGFICASELLVYDGARAAAVLENENYAPCSIPGSEKLPRITVADYLPLITDKAIARLERAAAAGPDRPPLFLKVTPYVPHLPLAVAPEFRGKTKAGDYGDYVHSLDHHVGRILDALDRLGTANNTLVLFASDNGSHFSTTGEAHRPNFPLRGTKHYPFEGGVRTPLILRWPGHVAPGTRSDALTCFTDLLPSIAAALNLTLPDGAAQDGLNLWPTFSGSGDPADPRDEVYIQDASTRFGLRVGDLKIIAELNALRTGDSTKTLLFDLAADPSERNNLAPTRPDDVARLQTRLRALLATGHPEVIQQKTAPVKSAP